METKTQTVNDRYVEAGKKLAESKQQILEGWKQAFQKAAGLHGYLDALRGYGDALLRVEAEAALAMLIELDCHDAEPARKLTARITDFTLTMTGLVDQMDGSRVDDLVLEIRLKALRAMTRTIQNLLATLPGEQP